MIGSVVTKRLSRRIGPLRVDPWQILARNAGLPAGAKLAVSDGGVVAFGERACSEPSETLDEQLAAAVAAAAEAWVSRVSSTIEGSPPGAWLGALQEAGWPAATRGDEGLVVTLEAPTNHCSATLVALATGGIALRAALVRRHAFAPAGRMASAHLLLVATATLPLVRAVAIGEGVAALEATVEDDSSLEGLAHALAALSVGVRCCAREAALLADDDALARIYLALRARALARATMDTQPPVLSGADPAVTVTARAAR